jgi:hypothetical protein
MPVEHDPVPHVDHLRQAVETPRRPIALFLSAGCPMAVADANGRKPLIPDVFGMTELLVARLEKSEGIGGPSRTCAPCSRRTALRTRTS